MGAANAETNAGTHHMRRAAQEMADLNAWFNCFAVDGSGTFCKRLLFRTASFCAERSGHFDSWDQGLSFFLPNASFLQPPGLVHELVQNTWQPNALSATVGTNASRCGFVSFDNASSECKTWGGWCQGPLGCNPAQVQKYGQSVGCPWSPLYAVQPGPVPGGGSGRLAPNATLWGCYNQPSWSGPASTVEECKSRCTDGAHNYGGGTLTASAQQSADRHTVVVRLSNMDSKPVAVTINLDATTGRLESAGPAEQEEAEQQYTATMWTMNSADPLAANTPARPAATVPRRHAAAINLSQPVWMEPTAVAVLVLERSI